MAYRYYQKEWKKYGDEFNLKIIGQKEAEKILSKLIRHFKLQPLWTVEYKKRNTGGTYWRRSRRISLHPTDIRLGVVCHELAHHWEYELRQKDFSKTYRKAHTKKHARCMKRLMKYCAKMKYWNFIKS